MKIFVFKITVFKKNPRKIKLFNIKLKFDCSLFLNCFDRFVGKIRKEKSMQNIQQIYEWKIVLQKFNKKNDKLNSNIDISKISHLPFDMLCYFIEIMMARYKMH